MTVHPQYVFQNAWIPTLPGALFQRLIWELDPLRSHSERHGMGCSRDHGFYVPASRAHPWPSFTAVAVSPAALLPLPLVTTDRAATLATYFISCDLPAFKFCGISEASSHPADALHVAYRLRRFCSSLRGLPCIQAVQAQIVAMIMLDFIIFCQHALVFRNTMSMSGGTHS